jgi:hypothetical protein
MNSGTIVPEALTIIRSLSTLLCCALPALLLALGAGAVVASAVAAVPQLVWRSEHKTHSIVRVRWFRACALGSFYLSEPQRSLSG